MLSRRIRQAQPLMERLRGEVEAEDNAGDVAISLHIEENDDTLLDFMEDTRFRFHGSIADVLLAVVEDYRGQETAEFLRLCEDDHKLRSILYLFTVKYIRVQTESKDKVERLLEQAFRTRSADYIDSLFKEYRRTLEELNEKLGNIKEAVTTYCNWIVDGTHSVVVLTL